MLQFEKSYAGEETTFFLAGGRVFSSPSDLSMVLSKLVPGFGSQWTCNVVTIENEKLLWEITQEHAQYGPS